MRFLKIRIHLYDFYEYLKQSGKNLDEDDATRRSGGQKERAILKRQFIVYIFDSGTMRIVECPYTCISFTCIFCTCSRRNDKFSRVINSAWKQETSMKGHAVLEIELKYFFVAFLSRCCQFGLIEATNQSSINHPINHPAKKPTSHSVSQQFNQPINHSTVTFIPIDQSLLTFSYHSTLIVLIRFVLPSI